MLNCFYFFFLPFFFDFFFGGGTLAPARRASASPMAIACWRLLTFLRDRPLRNAPRLRSCIACFTFADACLLYLAIVAPGVGVVTAYEG